jgi:hypothetical protein
VIPSFTSVPVVVDLFPAGQAYVSVPSSYRKSAREKVPSSRFDLSMTGMCGVICFSSTS